MLPVSFSKVLEICEERKNGWMRVCFYRAIYPRPDEYHLKLVFDSSADKQDLNFQNFRLPWIFDVLQTYL